MKNFADRLLESIEEKENPSIIGLDSDLIKIPGILKEEYQAKYGNTFKGACECILEFNKTIINAIKDIVPAVKVQSAFYEQYGSEGIKLFEETIKFSRKNKLIAIADVKRNDIGSTSKAYSNSYLGKVDVFGEKKSSLDVDAITVNAYLGSDGIMPFVEDVEKYGKGIFVLVKTSNQSSSEIQDLNVGNKKIYEVMAELVNKWGSGVIGNKRYSSVGAVVGATYPKEAAILRRIMPKSIFLVPGYGAQGSSAEDIIPCFNKDKKGAIIHSARAIIFAYEKRGNENKFDVAAKEAALQMKEEINKALKDKV